MCVCPNKCVSLSHSASASYKRFRPRQQHGSAGREIAFHFCIGYLLCLWICRQWERKLISHCCRRQYKRQTVITWCLEKVKEAKVEEVDQQEEVSGENWGVGVLKTFLRLWVKMILFLIILLLHRCCCTGKSVLCVCVWVSVRVCAYQGMRWAKTNIPSEWLESQRPSTVSRIGLAGNQSSFQCPHKTSVGLQRKKKKEKK